MKKLTAVELNIAHLIQRNIPLISRPFLELAASCNLTENEVLDMIKILLQNRVIRKFGAVISHQKAGFTRNALVLWSVPPDQTEKAGKQLATYDFVSHCYERKPSFQAKYNLFTMLHATDKFINSLASKMAAETGITDYLILESVQEYKKISPEYF